ncbi:MAG: C39 family peptidase [Coriobacteriales bacterium]|jgi:hypothetical protein|nr:C39 family peptidase [Coriobacteriales bacterium]
MQSQRYTKTLATITCLVIALSVLIVMLPFDTTKRFDAAEYNYAIDTIVQLDGVPVFTQETNHTCYATSMVVVENYLGVDTTESALLNELSLQNRDTGLIPNEYISHANRAFNPLGYSVSLVNPKSEAMALNIITASLLDGLPVVFYYSVIDDWNKPQFNTHYSVIFGIDMKSQTLMLSNPYGYMEELSFTTFFEGLSFKGFEPESFMHLMGRKVGLIRSNNLFVFSSIA